MRTLKRTIRTLFFAMFFCLFAAFAACGKDDNPGGDPVEPTKQYTITMDVCDGVTATYEKTAEEGKAYSFTLVLQTGYSGTLTVAAYVGETPVDVSAGENGSYLIAKITGNTDIVVTGATAQKFSVTKPTKDNDHVIVNGNDYAEYGKTYGFSVRVAEDYVKTDDFEVSATMGGAACAVTPGVNSYSIANVTGDLVITVKGVKLQEKYPVPEAEIEEAKTIEESVYSGGNFKASAESAPKGFSKVAESKNNHAAAGQDAPFIHGQFLSGTNLKKYSKVYFAVKSNLGYRFTPNNDEAETLSLTDWIYFYLTKNDNATDEKLATWNLVAACNDVVVFKCELNPENTEAPASLLAMLWKNVKGFCPIGFTAEDVLEIYCTELKGIRDPNAEPDVPPYGDLITNDLFASGTEVETSVPDGFTTMKKITAVWDESKKSSGGAKTVWADIANIDVSEYLTIRLQLQISGSWVLFDGWSTYFSGGKTIDVMMTHKMKTSWEIAFVGADGAAKVTRNGNNLNELLKMELDARSVALGDADCNPSTIIFSDVRGEKGAIPVEPIPVTGTIADEKLYSANGIGTSETEEAIPQGFEKIAMYTTNGANVHGQFFSAVNISAYSEVHFAVKTDGKFVLNQEKSDDSGEWLYFTLTQGADQTWTIVIKKADGTEIYNKGGFGGYKSDSPSPYTNYALNAILYGCPAGGFYPEKANDSAAMLNVWFTEVRGIKKS